MSPADWGPAQWLVIAIALQRLGELILARRNTARLLAEGGTEVGSGHYGLIVAVHATWLIALFIFVPVETMGNLWLIAAFLLLQIARIWIIVSLGRYWTTRIITVPAAPLIKRGPYRWMRHPNYLIVSFEIALLPLAFGDWVLALVFSIANAIAMCVRIPAENRALAARHS